MKSLTDKFFRYVAGTSGEPMAIEISRAQGMYLYTPDHRRYLDMIAGISVCNAGHSHPDIVEAVQRQAAKYMHLMVYGELVESPQVELAALLASQLPESLSSVYFVNSGAEAVEGALKLAKRATGRREILHCHNAYHGCSNGALSVMGNDSFKTPFQPLLPGTREIVFGNYDDLERITTDTACFIVEPVQGEAGVRIADAEYWKAVRKRCHETGTLLIFDEIQTGLGRTGKMFCFQHYDIKPDILLLAKALGGGMPLGAFIASPELMKLLTHDPALGHMTTFGGHPVSCAAGLAHLQWLINNDYPSLVEEKGARLEQILSLQPKVKEVRRKGLMMAADFEDPAENIATYKRWLAQGIFVDWFLFCDTALRIAPPFILEEEHMEEFKKLIEA